MEKKTYIILFIITVFAFILRLIGLEKLPPSLNWDEVSHGYNAYSVLKTGTDEWGNFPLINFRAYGDYPASLNLFLTIPFILIFGLTEFAIRFPHVILGTLTVVAAFFLALGITKNKSIGLITAFLVAIEPWFLFSSRAVFQSNLAVFLLTTAGAFYFNRDLNKNFLKFSYIILFLTLFAYHTTRIFSPLIIIAVIFFQRKEELKEGYKKIYVALFLIVAFAILLNPTARARGKYLSLLGSGEINKIESLQNKHGRLVVNKVTYFIYRFSTNYISYFSPNFLFLKGGTQYQFSVPGQGLMYLINMPFFYIGLTILIIKALKKSKENSYLDYRLILVWLILAPIPASLTNEVNAVIRSTTFLPIPQILVALGVIELAKKIKSRSLFYLAYVFVVLFSLEHYAIKYVYEYRNNYSWSWQYGYKEVSQYIKENTDNYAKIIVTKKYGEPHEFLLFNLKYEPSKYKTDKNLNRFFQSDWYWVDGFDKFYFVNDWQIPKEGYKFLLESKKTVDCRQAKCLLVTSPGNAPKEWKKVDTINFLDGKTAFELYEND